MRVCMYARACRQERSKTEEMRRILADIQDRLNRPHMQAGARPQPAATGMAASPFYPAAMQMQGQAMEPMQARGAPWHGMPCHAMSVPLT